MKNFNTLEGRIALVTGAAGGLGQVFCRRLGEAGAAVVLAGRTQESLEQVAQTLRADGIVAATVVMDTTHPDSVKAAFDSVQQQHGVIDILVANAGTTVTKRALDVSFDEWTQIINVNLTGSWLVCREAAARLVHAGQPGSLIAVSSILGHRVAGAVLPYTVSKAGLEQMVRALALEWARYGIRVNALAPGYIETDLNRSFFEQEAGQALVKRIPTRRLGRPDDLSGALLLLASDASLHMTGSTIVVDGGHLQSSL